MAEAELNPATNAPGQAVAPSGAAPEGEEAPSKKSKLPLIIAIVVVLVLAGGGRGRLDVAFCQKEKRGRRG